MQITAKEAKQRFGEVMSVSGTETVMITKYGRPERAVISAKRLEEFESVLDLLEDEIDMPIITKRLAEYDRTGEAITLEDFASELRARK